MECLLAICYKCGKSLFSGKKWNIELIKTPYHVTTLITHHDIWSVFVTKKLNVLPATFEKYAKILHFLPQYTYELTKTLSFGYS